jgi:hypothetical protein
MTAPGAGDGGVPIRTTVEQCSSPPTVVEQLLVFIECD